MKREINQRRANGNVRCFAKDFVENFPRSRASGGREGGKENVRNERS